MTAPFVQAIITDTSTETVQFCSVACVFAHVHGILGSHGDVCNHTPKTTSSELTRDSNLSATFWNGGPRALVWGCIAVVLGSLTQAYSMAELGSILPIAGAQYHWTHILAPDHSRRFITWMQGTS